MAKRKKQYKILSLCEMDFLRLSASSRKSYNNVFRFTLKTNTDTRVINHVSKYSLKTKLFSFKGTGEGADMHFLILCTSSRKSYNFMNASR